VTERRRRIDIVLEPEYLEGLDQVDLPELRQRRETASELEAQISYYRRLLHGRMDLLAFEMKRRRGEESRTLMEALPEILASGLVLGDQPNLKHLDVMPPLPSTTGRRLIDKIMDDAVLTQLPDLTDEEVQEALDRLSEVEAALSAQRRQLHNVIDTLQAEIVARLRSSVGDDRS
jgi:hypothetical protein